MFESEQFESEHEACEAAASKFLSELFSATRKFINEGFHGVDAHMAINAASKIAGVGSIGYLRPYLCAGYPELIATRLELYGHVRTLFEQSERGLWRHLVAALEEVNDAMSAWSIEQPA